MNTVSRNTSERLKLLFRSTTQQLMIVTPFIAKAGVSVARSNLTKRFRASGNLTILTNLSARNIYQRSTDPRAVEELAATVVTAKVHHLASLHAKVFVADQIAIVTSANLTAGGVYRNLEYGVEITDSAAVAGIREELSEFIKLGTAIECQALSRLIDLADTLQTEFDRCATKVRSNAKFRKSLRDVEDELIRLQVSGGAVHTVFARTIHYLLRRHGPLETRAIHPLVASIHPDLCDDSVDRVIDGVHYGKKWKHAVRTAQQGLRRNNLVDFDGVRWHAREAL